MKLFTLILGSALLMTASFSAANAADKENTLNLQTAHGTIVIEMLPDVAPKHVEQVKKLVRAGFYNGMDWHRVVEGFVAQTGCPKGTGTGRSDEPNIPAEFNQHPFKRGTVGMARGGDPNSANSQWFICLTTEACQHLTGQYTAWGEVTSGMEAADKLKRGEADGRSRLEGADKVIKITVAADDEKAAAPAEEAPKAEQAPAAE